MADSRDKRNFNCGRRLDAATISRLADKTAHLSGRGTGLALQSRTALSRFAEYLRDTHEIRDLEKCSRHHLVGWIEEDLRPAVIDQELSRATAAFYLSCVNTVFRANGRNDVWASAKEYCIARGQTFTNEDLSNRHEDVVAYRAWLLDRAAATDGLRSLQYKALTHSVALEWSAGLRFRESLMSKIGMKDPSGDALVLLQGDGCKNNRAREVHPLDGGQALREAQRFITEYEGDFARGSLIPSTLSYKRHKSFARHALQTFREEMNRDINHHGSRHAFAHETYARLWEQRAEVRIEAPVKVNIYGREHIRLIAEQLQIGEKEARELDNEIRRELSLELGHNRLDVTYSYVGR